MTGHESDTSIVDPSKEVEVTDVRAMKEEMRKLKAQMVEMYQAWSQGHPAPLYPANPSYTPPLIQAHEPPTPNTSTVFPYHTQGYGATSYAPPAPPPKQNPHPPIVPVFVAPPPATLQRSSSEPLSQAHDTQYYPPEPTFKAPEPYTYTPHFEVPEEIEKPSKRAEQEEVIRKVKSREQSFRNMHGLGSQVSVAYSALNATTQAIESGTRGVFGKKRKEEDATIEAGTWSRARGPSPYYQPRPHHPNYPYTPYGPPQPYYLPPEPHFFVHHTQTYTQPPAHPQWRAPVPQSAYPVPQNTYPHPRAYKPGSGFRPNQAFRNERVQNKKTFTPLGESYTTLFHKLRQLGLLTPVEVKMPNPLRRNLDHSVSCEYCSGVSGHDTENCWRLKIAVQELIDTNKIEVQAPEAPNINQDPLPAHREAHVIELTHKGGKPKKPSQTVIRSSKTNLNKKSTSEKMVVQLKGVDNKPLSPKVLGSLNGVDGNVENGFKGLFTEVNMVEAKEGASKANAQFALPRAKVNDWKFW